MSDEPVMTPITPEEGGGMPPKVEPFGAGAAPASAAGGASGVSTIKLKPQIRKPMIRKPTIGGAPKPATPAPAPAPAAAAAPSKKATQSLAAVSEQMPAQAVLRKTGIIAEGIITPAQQQAAKSKTSRKDDSPAPSDGLEASRAFSDEAGRRAASRCPVCGPGRGSGTSGRSACGRVGSFHYAEEDAEGSSAERPWREASDIGHQEAWRGADRRCA